MNTESYVVRFWVKVGEYWQQQEEKYTTNSRSSHKKIEKQWRNKYKTQQVKLISVIYQ